MFPVLRVFWWNNMVSTVENTPGNAISKTLNFKMSLDASVLNNLCLWYKFQSRLLFIISLLLKNFLTALLTALISKKVKIDVCSLTPPYHPNQKVHSWVNTSESWGLQASNVPLSCLPYLFIYFLLLFQLSHINSSRNTCSTGQVVLYRSSLSLV